MKNIPASFGNSWLRLNEEVGVKLGVFFKPRQSRTKFGIGFQDLGFSVYDSEVEPTPSRTLKFIFKEVTRMPQPGILFKIFIAILILQVRSLKFFHGNYGTAY
jgi:hypothetical protein